VPERALEILKPCFAIPKVYAVSAPTSGTEAGASSTNNLSNRFNLLDIEELDDDNFEFKTSDLSVAKHNNGPKSKGQVLDVFELDLDQKMDIPFRIYCFF
jgi:hypothetical protein